jgi:predicted nucleic acid-binding protein
VPLITLDTSVALPAMLSPLGVPRKLLVVLAFGAARYRAEHLRLERDLLIEVAERQGGRVHGLDVLDAAIEDAERQRVHLAELLPSNTPDTYVAAGFATLFDEHERKLREIGHRLDPALRHEDVPRLRRQLEAICVAGPPAFDPTGAPALTRDPTDDPIVLGALLAGSDFLISDDRDIVPDAAEHDYEHGEHRLRAVTFRHFIRHCFEPDDFPWRRVDGRWLQDALRSPSR